MVQDVEVTFMGKTFLAFVIKEELEGVERMEIKVPWQWRTRMNSASLVVGGGDQKTDHLRISVYNLFIVRISPPIMSILLIIYC